MNITVTKEAAAYMKPFQKEGEKWLLVYEKVGCTCSEEGIFSLRLVHHLPHHVESVTTDVGEIYVPVHQKVYLDKQMEIRYNPTYHDLEFVGAYEGILASHFIIENEDGSQRHRV